MTAGTTESVNWEIEQLRRWGVLDKCLFLLPPGTVKDLTQRRGHLLRALSATAADLALEDEIDPRTEAAFRMRADGTLVRYVASGQDFFNTMLVILSFWKAMTSLSVREWDDLESGDVDDGRTDAGAVAQDRAEQAARESSMTPKPMKSAGIMKIGRYLAPVVASIARNKTDKALARIDTIMSRFERDPDLVDSLPALLSLRADLLGELGRWEESFASRELAIAHSQDNEWTWDASDFVEGNSFRAKLLVLNGEILLDYGPKDRETPVRAIEVFTRAVADATAAKERRTLAAAWLGLGRARVRSRRAGEALEAFRTAAQYYSRLGDVSHVVLCYQLGRDAAERVGDLREAQAFAGLLAATSEHMAEPGNASKDAHGDDAAWDRNTNA
jgi:tetratricopeptide (TPR) repeat protein